MFILLRKFGATVAILAALLSVISQTNAATLPPPQVAVSPPRVEIAFENGSASSAVRLFNLSTEPLEVEVQVGDWYLDEQNNIVRTAPGEDSLSRWMLLSPRRFQIAGKESQALRFAFRPKTQPRDGEHRAMLYLRQVGSEPVAGVSQFLFQFAVPVYIESGEIVRDGVLNGIDVAYQEGVINAAFDISSGGNAKVRMAGHYRIRRVSGETLDLANSEADATMHREVLPDMPVLAGTRRTIQVQQPLDLPSGRYVFEVEGDLADRSMATTVEFLVP